MIRKAALAVAIITVLAAAAIVRPPRAEPALSFASAAPLAEASPPLSPRAKSRGHERRAHQRRSRRHDNPPLHRVDLNRADAATLARIPGVGDWLAERIVEYRGVVGPFETLDDLSDLDGISATRLASLGRYVVVR